MEGGIPLSLADTGIRASLGWLFTWKSCILLGVVVLAVFFYRPFCKWLCPLGAFYGLCNKVSVYRLEVDQSKCTSCGACSRVCQMDVDVFRTPNHAECIRWGDCVAACPHQAITKTFSLKNKRTRRRLYNEKKDLLCCWHRSCCWLRWPAVPPGEDNSLVSKTPFPEFSEADTEGNPVSSDIFADYDATIVNFWNNGCGTCIEEMRSWRSCITSFRSGTSISSA